MICFAKIFSIISNKLMIISDTCESVLGDGEFATLLEKAFDIICFLGIALVLVLTSLDFFQAIVAKDQEKIKKTSSSAVTRLVIAIIIFFLPIVLDLLLELLGMNGVCIE